MNRLLIGCMTGLVLLSRMVFTQNTLPKDTDGWTMFAPSEDTRIMYVSQSDGEDETAETYSAYDPAVGNDPFIPSGEIRPFKTIAAAFEQARSGYPDWVLFKRGDMWYGSSITPKDGRSADEPSLVAGYGSDGSAPMFMTTQGIRRCCKNMGNIAVSGLSFYASTRDPASQDYSGPDGNSGIEVYVGEEFTGTGLLIEGCTFRFFANNVIQGPGILNDLVIRRCVILDNYSSSAHSQGLYTKNVSLLLEENIFDHNGWYMWQIDGGNEQDSGQATMFNHDTYFCNSQGVTFRGNMFLRSSSIGTKWTANDGEGSAHDILIDNNLYVEGELGISMGGNKTDPPYRFKNITVRDNVFTDIGRDHPTNRSLAWYLEMNDWDIGLVEGNLFLHEADEGINNVFAIKLIGQSRKVTISKNIVHGLGTSRDLVVLENGDEQESVTFSENVLQASGLEASLLRIDTGLENYSLTGNTYYSGRNGDEWFSVDGNRSDFDAFVAAVGENDASVEELEFPEANRTPEAYNAAMGGAGTWEDFLMEARSQSRYNWKPAYTAAAVNEWIREGFGRERQSVRYGRVRGSVGRLLQTGSRPEYFTLQGKRIQFSSGNMDGIILRRDETGRCERHIRLRK